ncbi:MAG: GGDEF domain-containing protein [Spirochaetota bacterium]
MTLATSREARSFLHGVAIFQTLSDEELDHIGARLQPLPAEDSWEIFREGEEGTDLFVVRRGTVTAMVGLPDGSQQEVARFNDGDFFGEMSIFERAPRSATCRAEAGTELYRLSEGDFNALLANEPEIAIKVMYEMLRITAGRLENTSGFLGEMVRWGEGAKKRAVTDEFTGLFNRRFLDESLSGMFQRAKSARTQLCLVMVDLDHFNEINQEHGESVGDEVLSAVVPIFRSVYREADVLARYGGDEFTFVLPETSPAEARELSEQVRQEVASLSLLADRGGEIDRVTTSQGIAAFPDHANDLQTLSTRADEALYGAKTAGRNRVVVAGTNRS